MKFQEKNRISRRLLIGGAVATAGIGGAAALGAFTRTKEAPPRNIAMPGSGSRTHVRLLGTAGGPGWQPESGRQGISSALVVGDKFYLIDAGEGVGGQLKKANLGSAQVPGVGPLDGLNAVFLTHLHSDHVSDLSNIFLLGPHNGLQVNPNLPVQLFGPGNRGALPPNLGPEPAPEVVGGKDPTPGTSAMWNHLVAAFATDFNDRARDNGLPVPSKLVEAHDIILPTSLAKDPNGNPHPRMSPVFVHEDDRVRVTATLVQHAPVFPAFAFRFDTDDGSVVFSGDTGPSENLIELAKDTDVLVHEVISRQFLEKAFGEPRTSMQEGVLQHLLRSHTTIEDVGPVAEKAGAGTLVLNHLVPGILPEEDWKRAQHGYSGRLVVGKDLDIINVGN